MIDVLEYDSDSILFVTLGDLQEFFYQIAEGLLSAKMKKDEANNALVPRQVAAIRLDISLSTLDRWTKLNIVKSIKKGSKVFYKESDLIRLGAINYNNTYHEQD